MKRGLLILFIGLVASLVCNNIHSQTIYTWNIAGGGSWATATNWTPARNTPAANDILRFTNGGTKTITNVPTQTIGKIQITGNSNITLQANTSGNATLTASTAAADAIDVDAGSTLQIMGVRVGGSGYGLTLTTANSVGLGAAIDGTVAVTYDDPSRNTTLGVFTKGGTNATINFNSGSVYTHNVDASLIPIATWNTNSTCNITGLTDASPSNLNQSFGNFTYQCPGHNTIINFNSALTTITGDFTVKQAGYVQGPRTLNGLALSSNANFTLNIGGNLILDHSNAEAAWLILTTGSANVIVNIAGDFLISNTGTGYVYFDYKFGPTTTMGTLVVSVTGNFIQTGGYLDMAYQASGYSVATELRLSGNFSQTGANSIYISSGASLINGKIVFTKTGTQTIYCSTPGNLAYTNFQILSGSTLELLSNLYVYSYASSIKAGQFAVNGGGILDAGTYQILSSSGSSAGVNNSFNLNSGAGIVTANTNGVQNTTLGSISTSIATRTYSSGANYTYDGTSLQYSGTFTTSPVANQVNILTINNTAGINTTGVTLQQEFRVAGVCTFLSGVITSTNTNILTILDDVQILGTDLDAGSTKYVNGPIKKIGNDPFAFPVGKISHGCRPIYISQPSNITDVFRAELIRGNAGLLGPITAIGLERVSACEYWYLDRLVGSSSVDVSLSWSGESPCNAQSYVTDLPNLVVAHFNGASWDAYGNDGGTTGNAVKGTVTWNNVSTFSPFSLGSLVWWSNPLTVKFINLQAHEKNGQVKVEWGNIAETGVDKYFVEYSTDGRRFDEINNTTARKNNGERTDYLWWHTTPVNGVIYYRIKAIEFTGDVSYSHVVRLDLNKNNSDLTVYPNPVKGNNVNIAVSGLAEGKYDIVVLNMSGQKIMQRSLNHAGGSISIQVDLPETIKAGVYSIKLSGSEKAFVKTFIVQ